ncbi:MAG: ribosome biogenesis GTP-binding protein YihA/YsxC [Campylobacterota bacterium]|nr:ribosome biogenesis GTP-binding protein YihA/YsxC [Campylobacterota bacterium]
MRIVETSFLKSAANISQSIENEYQNEVAFIARSNSGKSSLLNAISNRKSLAKVSSTPGKTRLINFFSVVFQDDKDEKFSAIFVDLPGFGYAKVSKSIKSDWEKNLTKYTSERKQIKLFIHLIDARHPHLEIDASVREFLAQTADESQYILEVFTKIDKLNQKELSALRREFPEALMVSSSKKRGIEKLLNEISESLFEDLDEH